ncbi:MAG TPA: hypothetical protein VFB37_00605, partial [Steroidobacteraceae bacterium]|nr:hypothetical protein [Steroidobacteraceae bacterium]
LGPGGRVRVLPDCSIPGAPNVFVIGDAAYLVDSRSGAQVPGVSQAALQMGRYVARVIREDMAAGTAAVGAPTEAGATLAPSRPAGRRLPIREAGFHYVDLGAMATIGKSRAVVERGRLRFGGVLAWFAWLTLHVTVLIGFRNRIAVLLSWIYSYIFFRRGSRLITGVDPGQSVHARWPPR